LDVRKFEITAPANGSLQTVPFMVVASEQTPGTASSTATIQVSYPRFAGSFVDLKANIPLSIGTPPVSYGPCAVSFTNRSPSDPTYYQYDAVLQCSSNHVTKPFAVGGPFNIGGLGMVTSVEGLAVVFSRTDNSQDTAGHVHFDTLLLPGLKETDFSAYDVNMLQPPAVGPAIWVSPDGTVVIVTTLTPNASATTEYTLNVYDLLGITPSQSLKTSTYAKSLDAAVLVTNPNGHQSVIINVDGNTASLPPININ
jgi:hypothetical protein